MDLQHNSRVHGMEENLSTVNYVVGKKRNIIRAIYFCFPTGINPVFLTGFASGRHIVEVSPLGCSGGSKTLSVKFTI